MAHEVAKMADGIDAIGCFDARGFLFAPYLGARFQKKVFMLRKPGKMPSVSHTIEYFKEYSGDNAATGGDHLSIQHYAVKAGDRVLLIDDLLATGGTAEAGVKLVQQAGGVVAAVLVAVEIAVLNGRKRVETAAPDSKLIALLNENNF
jgi:adenine phosphoribosyltransferase